MGMSVRDPKRDGSQSEGSALTGSENEYVKARQQVQVLRAKLDGLLKFLRPAHPKIIKLNEEIAQQENLISLFKKQSVADLASRRDGIRLQIQNLEKVVKEWEVKALALSQRMAEYEQIRTKVERAKSLYERLSASVQGIDLNRSVSQEVVTVMERASPGVSIKPVSKVMTMGGLIGFGFGVVILMLLNRLDTRVHSLAELQEILGEPVVGQVPFVRAPKGVSKPALLSPHDERHAFSESFKSIRSLFLFPSSDAAVSKIVMITSGVPNEGKSTVAQNLAITMAMSGARTLWWMET